MSLQLNFAQASATGPREENQDALRLVTPAPELAAVIAEGSVGDYRAGDEIWCERLAPDRFASALNRDVLVPRPGGRFTFGRLLARDGARLQVMPPGPGARQQVVAEAPLLALAEVLVREL